MERGIFNAHKLPPFEPVVGEGEADVIFRDCTDEYKQVGTPPFKILYIKLHRKATKALLVFCSYLWVRDQTLPLLPVYQQSHDASLKMGHKS